MGPSVKFVSPNKGLISKKKIGGQFFSEKNPIPGGGVRGGFGKKPYFFPICFSEVQNPSLIIIFIIISTLCNNAPQLIRYSSSHNIRFHSFEAMLWSFPTSQKPIFLEAP